MFLFPHVLWTIELRIEFVIPLKIKYSDIIFICVCYATTGKHVNEAIVE